MVDLLPPPASRVAKVAFFAIGLPAALRAWWRVRLLIRSEPLDEVVARLREVPAFRWSSLRRPSAWCGLSDRVVRWLPRFGLGPCLLRSLMLLDLWSRCGIAPRLHLAVRRTDPAGAEGHAWVTSDLRADLATSDQGYAEAFSL